MRIGFDLSVLSHPHPLGIQRLARCLTESLEQRGQIEVVRLEPERGASLRTWRRRDLPRSAASKNLAGIHSFTSAFPIAGPGLRLQSVHELPWLHGVSENADWRHKLWAALGPVRADAVLVGTQFVAQDLKRRWLPGKERIHVCPWGVEPAFQDEAPLGEVDEVLLGSYRLPEDPLLICPGAVREKKNLNAVLEGLAVLHKRAGSAPHLRAHLLITGPETPVLRRELGSASKLGLSRWVSTVDEIEEAHLPGMLRLAAATCVLSKSEGFGFPVLESMASGTPVLVPVQSAQAEVAGEAGIQVDPDNPESVADGLERALTQREVLRPTLVARAESMRWPRCAEQVESIWRGLLP